MPCSRPLCHTRPFFQALLSPVIAACLSCGDSLEVPGPNEDRTATLEISIATTGAEPDGDGYLVQVDAETARRVASGEMIRLSVSAGIHRVELSDIAPTCRVASDNPQSVAVAEEETSAVDFKITCTPSPQSSIQVTITTSGDELDPDGYAVSLDHGELQPVGANGAHEFTGVTNGVHVVELSGIARNCRVTDSNRVQVMVDSGGALAAFTIDCFGAGIPGWNAIALPGGFIALGVWGTSSSDLFVTGRDAASSGGVILHYDGNRWVEQFRTAAYLGPVMAIWGISPSDVFAGGGNDLLLHYDGRQWSQSNVSPIRPAFYEVLWGSSARDVFVGGGLDDTPGGGLARRYGGGQWTALSGHSFGTYGAISDISGTSPSDVYFVGRDSPYDVEPEDYFVRHAIRHYNGVTWTTSFESVQYDWTGEQQDWTGAPRGVWANATNDVFAVGSKGMILHYDGHTWTRMTSPTRENLTDLWGRSSSDVYAVGPAGILHYDGGSWSVLGRRPETCPDGGNCIWGTAADVFVVSGAVILHGTR